MAALLAFVITHTNVFSHYHDHFVLNGDTMSTFGLAVLLITAAMGVIAILPWTDQQITATDAEARRVGQHLARVAVQRMQAVPVVAARLS